MSLSSGKVSGKTPPDPLTGHDHPLMEPCPRCNEIGRWLLERIAELEAELADIDHALRHEFCADDMHAARALLAGKRKAEAEVERLRPYEAHVRSHDDVCCRCVYEGGGRESGMAAGREGAAPSGPAAADPAALYCSSCGEPIEVLMSDCGHHAAARKERPLRYGSPSVNETKEV